MGELTWSSRREKAERSVKIADEMKQKIAECKTGQEGYEGGRRTRMANKDLNQGRKEEERCEVQD